MIEVYNNNDITGLLNFNYVETKIINSSKKIYFEFYFLKKINTNEKIYFGSN